MPKLRNSTVKGKFRVLFRFEKFLKDNGNTTKIQKGVAQNLTLNDMQKILKDMPEYKELATKYSLHFDLIGKCLSGFNTSHLKVVGDAEQTVATGVDGSLGNPSSADAFNTAIKLMADGTVGPMDKLRMAILIVSSMHLNAANLQRLKSLLPSQGDARAFDNLVYLGVRNDTSKGATKFKVTDDEKKYFKNYAKAAKFDLQRFTPRLQQTLEEVYTNTLNKSEYNVQTVSSLKSGAPQTKKLLSNDLLVFKTGTLNKHQKIENKDKLIVFFVGGMAYSEVRVVKECGTVR